MVQCCITKWAGITYMNIAACHTYHHSNYTRFSCWLLVPIRTSFLFVQWVQATNAHIYYYTLCAFSKNLQKLHCSSVSQNIEAYWSIVTSTILKHKWDIELLTTSSNQINTGCAWWKQNRLSLSMNWPIISTWDAQA